MARRVDDSEIAEDRIARAVPVAVRIAGAWSWPIVGLLILVALAVYLVVLLHVVVIPVLVAVLVTGLMNPLKLWLMRHGWPKGLAVVATFLTLLVVLAALVTLVTLTVRSGLGDIQDRTASAYRSFLQFLSTSPFGVSQSDLQSGIDSATKWVQQNASTLLSGALTGASTVGDIAVGLVLSLFITLFFLIDGAGVWRWLTRLAPVRARAAVDGGGRAA